MTNEAAILVTEQIIKNAQKELDRLMEELKAEKPEPEFKVDDIVLEERIVTEVDVKYDWPIYKTCSPKSGATCYTTDKYLRLRAPDEPKALYEEGKVFWSRRNERVFVLTGKVIPENTGWQLVGTTLCSPTIYGINSYPEARILDVKVYEFKDDRYIHDGGPEQLVKKGDMFINIDGSVGRAYVDYTVMKTDDGKCLILVKLREVE